MPRYRKNIFSFLPRRKRPYHRHQEPDNFSFSALSNSLNGLSAETKKGIFIIFLFALSALSVLGLLDLSGRFGNFTDNLLSLFLGDIKWLFPILLGAWIFCSLNEHKYPIRLINYLGVFLTVVGLAGLFHLPFDSWGAFEMAKAGEGGGYVGALIAWPLISFMGFWGALVILIAMLLVGILLALETSIYGIMWPIKLIGWLFNKFKEWRAYQKMKKQEQLLESLQQQDDNFEEETADDASLEESEEEEIVDAEEVETEPAFIQKEIKMSFKDDSDLPVKKKKFGPIEIPIGLLSMKSGKPTSGDIKNNQEIIRRTLNNFGIPVEMGDVNVGPTVTQYTMRPIDGVRLSKIVTLNADLALALAAHPIRIEAPIPGKSLVGIEIPNIQNAKVTMGEMLAGKEFKNRSSNLSVALGKDVSGKPIFAQLDKMPHLLVAGATGSGKSVCINSIIISLMYQNSPDDLKFILVDPKRVELPLYNNTPYLLTPVITDVKKTISALKWGITEMERRFELLAKFGNRNIVSYNQTHSDKLPYIVIIIDELADLMASSSSDMEAGIVRLAQMARAVGIHLILATQRPSTEVITGLIKANIPARIAFSVASSIDSRTILDGSGAEKLVGKGDMLYLGPEFSKPKRIQGVFLSDKEISDVIKYIKSCGEVDYVEALNTNNSSSFGGSFGGGFGDGGDEPLIMEAIEVIKESGKASASLLQRRLKLGYARAARILDILEEKGIIGPADGAKPREVFLDQLPGTDPVSFSAKEHNLSGELRSLEQEEEPTFTAFSNNNSSISVEQSDAEDFDDTNPFLESEIGGGDFDNETTNETDNSSGIEDVNENIIFEQTEVAMDVEAENKDNQDDSILINESEVDFEDNNEPEDEVLESVDDSIEDDLDEDQDVENDIESEDEDDSDDDNNNEETEENISHKKSKASTNKKNFFSDDEWS